MKKIKNFSQIILFLFLLTSCRTTIKEDNPPFRSDEDKKEIKMLSSNFCNGGKEIYEIKNLKN